MSTKTICLILALLLALPMLSGCGGKEQTENALQPSASESEKVSEEDNNREPEEDAPLRVVFMQASLADIWIAAGGTAAGVTEDAFERDLPLGDAVSIGTTKKPSAEAIIDLEPDLVVYSPDIAGQLECAELLESCGIRTLAAKEDNFSQYIYNLKVFTTLLDNEEAFDELGSRVRTEIEEVKALAAAAADSGMPKPKVLFMRAFSTGCKAKATDHVVCDILDDLQAENIAKAGPSLLEGISVEVVAKEDPDMILIVFMGDDEEAARKNLDETLFGSPVWQQLSAVKNGRVIYLPKDLFHYKPNHRWARSYRYIYDLLYENQN